MSAITFDPDTVNPQQFSIPRNVIYYILMNPTSPKLYLKLANCCKYFYAKNKIFIADDLEYSNDNWKAVLNYQKFATIPDNCSHKLWITDRFGILKYNQSALASTFLQKVVNCDITSLTLTDQKITWKEFLLLTSSKKIKICDLLNVEMINDKNEPVLFEKILEQLPSLKWLDLLVKDDDPCITPDTVPNILKLPKFENLEKFYIRNVPRTFDIEKFLEFMNIYTATFVIQFVSPLNEDALAKVLKTKELIKFDFSPRRIRIEL